MKSSGLFFGLLLSALLLAGQAMALVAPPSAIVMPPTPDIDGNYSISWSYSVTPGASYVLEEATDAAFTTAAPVYTGTSNASYRSHAVDGTSYYYRVKATKAGDTDSTPVVGAYPVELANRLPAPASISVPVTDADGSFTVVVSKLPSGQSYVIEESTDVFATNSTEIYRGTTYYKAVKKGPALAAYSYRARAAAAGSPDSTPTAVKTVNITPPGAVILPAPASVSVPATDLDGSFTVVVSRLPSGQSYVIEESTDGFATNSTEIYRGTTYYKAVQKGPAVATYSYRARAAAAGSLDSAPSPVATVNVVALAGTTALSAANPTQGTAWETSRHANTNDTGPGSGNCANCHSPTGEKTAGGFGTIGCEGCHGIAVGGVLPASGLAAVDSCANCHNSHISASSTIASSWAASAHNNGTNSCANCHNPHSLADVTNATCTASCHTAAVTPHIASLLNCLNCHNPHTLAVDTLEVPASDITPKLSAHGLTGQVAISNVVVTAPGGTSVVMTYNVKLDGVNADNFTFTPAGYRFAASTTPTVSPIVVAASGIQPAYTAPVKNDFTRTTAVPTVVSNGNGNYTATWAGAPPAGNITYLASAYNAPVPVLPATRQEATAVGHLNAPARSIASNAGCINCHGNNPWRSGSHHGANPQGVEACVVCHTRATSISRGAGGDRTTAYVHGIHASEQVMAAGGFDRQFPVKDGVIDFKVTYPSYMTNCAVCHSTPAQLAAVNAAPVSYSLCFSCHDTWAGFDGGNTLFGGEDHAAFDWNEDCGSCHDGATAPATAADFHNGLLTERSGLIYNGTDVSVTEGTKVDMQITGITRTLDNADVDTTDQLVITWTANYNGTPVNPCNATVAVGAPIFHAGGAANTTTGQAAQNLAFLRAYGQGDDWVNAGIGTSPGQPVSTNLAVGGTASGATTCAGNVATTNIMMTTAEHASTALKGVVALQGKAQVKLPYTFDSPLTPAIEVKDVIQVRSKTPTREFVVATGAAPATLRREIVDTASCLKCHVGSLYQHGGNRVDNVDLCIMCHNEASSEKNVRLTTDGVDASEAYDGKSGQTYGFKSLLHAVHSSGETGAITEVHRTNGIYVFTGENTVIPHWPGEGSQIVYGSTTSVVRTHNLFHPTYPQFLQNCTACHKPGTFGVPDPTKAVATTLDAGAVATATENANQLDDQLQGPAAAACMSCHQSGDAVKQAKLTTHLNQGGFTPAVLVNGRADVLNGTTVVENCSKCHQ